jgi:hypothetical protein
MSIDLRPYGLDWSIDPAKPGAFIPSYPKVAQVKDYASYAVFTNFDGTTKTYEFSELLGEGSFGKTYKVDKDTVIKVIQIQDEAHDFKNALLEFIIQLLCVKDTENDSYTVGDRTYKGPFVPKLHLFGRTSKAFYIVSEKMDITFQEFMELNKNSKVLRDLILEIAKIVDVLQKKDYFSHRDFKSDNIMIKFIDRGKCPETSLCGFPQIKIIDFGFSCMKFNKLVLNSNPVPNLLTGPCYNKSRDLSSIFYNLLEFSYLKKYSSKECPMRHVIETLLLTKAKPKKWVDQYPHYNHQVEPNPNLFPENVIEIFENMEVEKKECGKIDPSWVKYIKVINSDVFQHLEPNELPQLDGDAVLSSSPLLSYEQRSAITSAKMKNRGFRQFPARRHIEVDPVIEAPKVQLRNAPPMAEINSRKRKSRKNIRTRRRR